MEKMGSSLAFGKNSKEEKPQKICENCQIPYTKMAKFYRCSKCNKCTAEDGYFEKKNLEKNQNETKVESANLSERKYQLRNGESNKKRIEPEVIELIDSDEELETQNRNSSDKQPAVQSKPLTNDAKYIYKDWRIETSDVETLDKMLRREASSDNNTIGQNVSNYPFHVKAKYVQLGGFKNDNQGDPPELVLSEKEGINLKIVDNENKVNIIIGTMDLKYCACIFHDPVYVLLMHIKTETAELYLRDLKSLENFDHTYSNGELVSTRLIVILDFKKELIRKTSCSIYNFFSTIQPECPNRINFIKLHKAKELLAIAFKYSKEKPEEVKDFTKGFKQISARVLAKYPLVEQPNSSTIYITEIDFACLAEKEFLNDNIISFYLKYLVNEVLSPEDRKRTHIFDTFFYQKLTHQSEAKRTKDEANLNAAERRYLRVKKWTRNVNIFEKDFLIIPINKNVHWYLAIVCYPYLTEPVYEESMEDSDTEKSRLEYIKKEASIQKKANENHDLDLYTKETESADEADPEDSKDGSSEIKSEEDGRICIKKPIILIFDSLLGTKNKRVIATIKEYLQCEWKDKYSKEMKNMNFIENMTGVTVNAPLQTNYFDCGIYLLQYVESFFRNPIEKFNTPINLEDWFDLNVIISKRKEIKDLIKNLRNQAKALESNEMAIEEADIKPKEELKISSAKKLKQMSDESMDSEDLESSRKNPKKILLDKQNGSNESNRVTPTATAKRMKTNDQSKGEKIINDFQKLNK